MEIIAGTTNFKIDQETAVAIGKFDGVHIGHRRLLQEILAKKSQGLLACVFTFDPAPAVFFGYSDGKELTTLDEKRKIFSGMGVDILVEFPLTRESAAIPAEVFATKVLKDQMRARWVAAGEDLSFGAGGAGDAALLTRMGEACGYQVQTIEKVCLSGEPVSSTRVRTQVEAGNMKEVLKLLGNPYTVPGRVVHGNHLGRCLGMPTANILPEPEKLMPPCGVYYSLVRLRDRLYPAVSNVGYKPTVTDSHVMGIESYLYDFHGDIYGERIGVELCHFKRPEHSFASLEDLRAQLELDIRDGRKWHESQVKKM